MISPTFIDNEEKELISIMPPRPLENLRVPENLYVFGRNVKIGCDYSSARYLPDGQMRVEQLSLRPIRQIRVKGMIAAENIELLNGIAKNFENCFLKSFNFDNFTSLNGRELVDRFYCAFSGRCSAVVAYNPPSNFILHPTVMLCSRVSLLGLESWKNFPTHKVLENWIFCADFVGNVEGRRLKLDGKFSFEDHDSIVKSLIALACESPNPFIVVIESHLDSSKLAQNITNLRDTYRQQQSFSTFPMEVLVTGPQKNPSNKTRVSLRHGIENVDSAGSLADDFNWEDPSKYNLVVYVDEY